MEAIVYSEAGDRYLGEFPSENTAYWREFGKSRGLGAWMYVGYRWFDNRKDQVVVFDDIEWDAGELARRKANGFLGIRMYRVGAGHSRFAARNPRGREGRDEVLAAVGATKDGDPSGHYELASRPKGDVPAADIIASGYEWMCPECGILNRFMEIPKHDYVECGDCGALAKAEPAEHAYG